MRGMVQLFGLSTDNNIGMHIASNVARFIQDSRAANSLRQRVPDVQRRAVNTVLTAMMSTPTKDNEPSSANNMSGRHLFSALGISQGSQSHLMKRCGKARTAVRSGVERAYNFLGLPRKNGQRSHLKRRKNYDTHDYQIVTMPKIINGRQ